MSKPTRWQIVTTAAAELGYTETPNNITKFWAARYPAWQGQPWCGCFVDWVLAKHGVEDYPIGRNGIFYTPAIVSSAKAKGAWRDDSTLSNAQPGDLVLFDFNGSDNAKHVGFIEKVLPGGLVQTIEGNTSSGTAGSQNDGGGVYRRVRGTATVMGYVDMSQVLALDAGDKKAARDWKRTRLAVHGKLTAGTISRLQAEVGVPIDGVLGPVTKRAVQRWVGVTPDGVWGKKTLRAIQVKVGTKKPTGRMTPDGLVKPMQRWLNDNRAAK